MKTWSIADFLDDTRAGVKAFTADWVSDARAIGKYLATLALAPVIDWACPAGSGDDDGPNLLEPSLDDDELVAVRGLIQERYDPPANRPQWLTDLIDAAAEFAADRLGVSADDIKAAIERDTPPCDHRYCRDQGGAIIGETIDELRRRARQLIDISNRK